MEQNCGNCFYFSPIDPANKEIEPEAVPGECQRFPPVLLHNGTESGSELAWGSPITIACFRCGEWKTKSEPYSSPFNNDPFKFADFLSELSGRERRAIAYSEAKTLGELIVANWPDIMTRKGIGPGTIRKISDACEKHYGHTLPGWSRPEPKRKGK